ncbi:acyl-CoA--6-aminopenicillanic acid acyl-transferase [Streptomyces amakusaensis]|uniref:C45 family peptidase n=1 Tax=Streptomyces amakusaensis TaxID=67271 RepID=A0ABW0AJR7_9ACTN
MSDIAIIRVKGGARERGLVYGRAAGERVRLSLENYERVYATFADLRWDAATALAETYIPAVEAFDASALEEMEGIALGAGVAFEDILALNLRTEILFSGKARKLASGVRPPGECTSFCDLRGPEPVVGQNWDWIPFSHRTVVVLEAVPETGPRWVSVVEAGLLAKFGMNSAGVTVLTNALVTSLDRGAPGMPYHLLLRALLSSESLDAAVDTLRSAHRSSSANYLVVGGGRAVDAEARPGGADDLHLRRVERGEFLVHANHFLGGDSDFASHGVDHGPRVMPDTLFRQERATTLAELMPVPSVAGWHEVLSDHANHPDSVCCHPDPGEEEPLSRGSTVASAVIEPGRRLMHLVLGHPCAEPRVTYDYGEFFA